MFEKKLAGPFTHAPAELQELAGGWLVTAAFFVVLIFV
jgi:hypothetical protein